jgi:hypothetical protein
MGSREALSLGSARLILSGFARGPLLTARGDGYAAY